MVLDEAEDVSCASSAPESMARPILPTNACQCASGGRTAQLTSSASSRTIVHTSQRRIGFEVAIGLAHATPCTRAGAEVGAVDPHPVQDHCELARHGDDSPRWPRTLANRKPQALSVDQGLGAGS